MVYIYEHNSKTNKVKEINYNDYLAITNGKHILKKEYDFSKGYQLGLIESKIKYDGIPYKQYKHIKYIVENPMHNENNYYLCNDRCCKIEDMIDNSQRENHCAFNEYKNSRVIMPIK